MSHKIKSPELKKLIRDFRVIRGETKEFWNNSKK